MEHRRFRPPSPPPPHPKLWKFNFFNKFLLTWQSMTIHDKKKTVIFTYHFFMIIFWWGVGGGLVGNGQTSNMLARDRTLRRMLNVMVISGLKSNAFNCSHPTKFLTSF